MTPTSIVSLLVFFVFAHFLPITVQSVKQRRDQSYRTRSRVAATTTNVVSNSTTTVQATIESILVASSIVTDETLFVYQTPQGTWIPSTLYRFRDFFDGLKILYQQGVAGKYFYMGPKPETTNENNHTIAHWYGLVNIAAFWAQCMKETIQYDACDENSWDMINGKYPLSNSCGQLGQSYQDYHCSSSTTQDEAHMECPVDPNMTITATTHAQWYGAPGPLQCGPKSMFPFTGYWDYNYECNKPWADPPEKCTDYPNQKAGRQNNEAPIPNNSGRTDVEGCCWWGRGVIQTSGICNFGKLNYYLGKRAADEGRTSAYPTIDFCKDPEVICSTVDYPELKWIAGLFYWVESVQSYNVDAWDYITKLHEYVDGGFVDTSFIDAVSGIVNRGCHNPPCGTLGVVDGNSDRRENFRKVMAVFNSSQDISTAPLSPSPASFPTENPKSGSASGRPPGPTENPTSGSASGSTPGPTENPTSGSASGSTPGTTPSAVPGTNPVNENCGDGNRGNGLCNDPILCCSKWGWCASLPEHCSFTEEDSSISEQPLASNVTGGGSSNSTGDDIDCGDACFPSGTVIWFHWAHLVLSCCWWLVIL
jgi:hypothetical protein